MIFWARPSLVCAMVGAALVSMSNPSRADWAYTHWGMTPEQVAAASAGKVKVLPPSGRTRSEPDRWEIAAEGDFTDGQLQLPVGFMFDLKDGRLVCVMANALGSDAKLLQAKLNERYGKPAEASNFGPAHTLVWRTPDKIEFSLGEQPLAAVLTHCKP